MLLAILAITGLGLSLGLILGLAAKVFSVPDENPLIKEIEALLPASQCGQCGFAGCAQAAEAIAEGQADLTCCPPGGRALVEQLAGLMNVDLATLADVAEPMVACIDESLCTGCTRCFKSCPTDAVVGANGQIHAVLQKACTGCKKCVAVCPENCIAMRSEPHTLRTWRWLKPAAA